MILGRTIGVLTVLVPLFLLTGCWSRVEINDRAFATALYVDSGESGKVRVTIGFPLPSRLVPGQVGNNPSGNPYSTLSKEGTNIADAVRLVQADLPREISWGMVRVIVVGKSYAEKGIQPVLEFAARQPNFQLKTYVLVSRTTAQEITKLTPVFERFPSEVLREMGNRRITLDSTVADFLSAAAEGYDVAAGILDVRETKMVSERNKPGTWVGSGGVAIFKENRMVGTLSPKDTRAMLWLKNKLRDAVITVQSPTDGKPVSILIQELHTRLRPKQEGDNIIFDIRIRAKDEFYDSESDINLLEPDALAKLQQVFSGELKQRIEDAFSHSQKLGADIFQLREHLSIYKPAISAAHEADWDNFYKEHTRVNVNVQILLKRPGAERNPIRQNR